jgi:hypothetical protein
MPSQGVTMMKISSIIEIRALGLLVALCATCHASGDAPALAEGKFGQAIVLKDHRSVVVPLATEMNQFPIAFDCWFKLDSAASHNILMAKGPKRNLGPNQMHWELFSTPGEGRLSLYIPQISAQENIGLSKPVADGQWHFASVRFDDKSVSLFVDGELVTKREHTSPLRFDEAPLFLGHLPLGSRPDPRYALGEGAVSITMNGIANFAMLYYTQVLGLGPNLKDWENSLRKNAYTVCFQMFPNPAPMEIQNLDEHHCSLPRSPRRHQRQGSVWRSARHRFKSGQTISGAARRTRHATGMPIGWAAPQLSIAPRFGSISLRQASANNFSVPRAPTPPGR